MELKSFKTFVLFGNKTDTMTNFRFLLHIYSSQIIMRLKILYMLYMHNKCKNTLKTVRFLKGKSGMEKDTVNGNRELAGMVITTTKHKFKFGGVCSRRATEDCSRDSSSQTHPMEYRLSKLIACINTEKASTGDERV